MNLRVLEKKIFALYDGSINESVMEKLFHIMLISEKVYVEQDKRGNITNIVRENK